MKSGKDYLNNTLVFVGTLASISRSEVKGKEFDYVIVDEAGQATEPATLSAFRLLGKDASRAPSIRSKMYPRIILLGDQKQLPPVVNEELFRYTLKPPKFLKNAGLTDEDTLKTSMFERLYRMWNGKSNLVILKHQYRMNDAICKIERDVFYSEEALSPANETIANRTLASSWEKLGLPREFNKQLDDELLKIIFDPSRPVILINTENDPLAIEEASSTEVEIESRYNLREAEIIAKMVAKYLLAIENPSTRKQAAASIGVISPYRRQNNEIKAKLSKLLDNNILDDLRIDTVDRFQGDEREIIILSLTNNNPQNKIGSLHSEWRRLNVSISRAKTKLIIVGNKKVFTEDTISEDKEEMEKERIGKHYFKKVFKAMDELKKEGKCVELYSENF